MENDAKTETNSMKNKLVNGAYHATHYRTYHSYRRSIVIAKVFLYLGFIFTVLGLIPINVNQLAPLNIAIFFYTTYLLYTYWSVSKNTTAKRDSRTVVSQFANASGVKGNVKGWSLYDGAYSDNDKESLEIVLTYERTFLGDALRLIRGEEPTLPLNDTDIEVLKFYLKKQQENNLFITYATIPENLAENFSRRGIKLTEISNKFRSRPSRWDYAVATGRMTNALWHFPRNFKAYLLSIDENNKKKE